MLYSRIELIDFISKNKNKNINENQNQFEKRQ